MSKDGWLVSALPVEEAKKQWLESFSKVFNPSTPFPEKYASAFVKAELSPIHPIQLNEEQYRELGVSIGHRKIISQLIEAVRNGTTSEIVESSKAAVDRKASNLDTKAWRPTLTSFNSSLNNPQESEVEWLDYEGEAPSYEDFLSWVDKGLLAPYSIPPTFRRGFIDNKPMAFAVTSNLVTQILLRQPTTALIQTPNDVKETTVATLTNRLVIIVLHKYNKLITYHKDSTKELEWLEAFKSTWVSEARDKLDLCHLVSSMIQEASQPARDVCVAWRTRLDQLVSVSVTQHPSEITELMSKLHVQSQVMNRCLQSNVDALDDVAEDIGVSIKSVVQFLRDVVQMADELDSNSMDSMNLRIGIVGFESQMNMKFFTYLSAILAPITVMSGWYGMNFEHMPELPEDNAYWVFIAVVGFTVIVLCFALWWTSRSVPLTKQQLKKLGID